MLCVPPHAPAPHTHLAAVKHLAHDLLPKVRARQVRKLRLDLVVQ